ncbi:MAG TPA: efflux RND transporter periplasmic adaptor subunit [Chthoniobacteraceae bacterium]|jgi:membrane fusion protein (multidrug efflux system)|nr:efflux RND transporter periplasmic adaptor subunit [Chthoniobacteraceae bacterium]
MIGSCAAVLLAASCKKTSGAAAGPPGGMATQVVAVKAQRQPVTETLSVLGNVMANETVDLKPEVDGRVVAINFEEGQQVEDGHLLVELNSGETEAMLAEAEANQQLAQTKWDRAKELLQTKAVSNQEADESKATFDMRVAKVSQMREQLRNLKVKAPFAGVVGTRHISPGQVVTKNTVIATLSDLDPVKIEGNVPERFLAQAKVGQKVKLSIAAFPGETFEGEVYFIAPQVDPVNRTGLVKAKVGNPDMRLKPGMFASAELKLKVREDAVVIPEAALMPAGEQFSVFVVDEQMTAQMRPVKPGVRIAGRAEIVEGLQGGETVIVEGWQKTRPGGKVKLAPEEKSAPYAAK